MPVITPETPRRITITGHYITNLLALFLVMSCITILVWAVVKDNRPRHSILTTNAEVLTVESTNLESTGSQALVSYALNGRAYRRVEPVPSYFKHLAAGDKITLFYDAQNPAASWIDDPRSAEADEAIFRDVPLAGLIIGVVCLLLMQLISRRERKLLRGGPSRSRRNLLRRGLLHQIRHGVGSDLPLLSSRQRLFRRNPPRSSPPRHCPKAACGAGRFAPSPLRPRQSPLQRALPDGLVQAARLTLQAAQHLTLMIHPAEEDREDRHL